MSEMKSIRFPGYDSPFEVTDAAARERIGRLEQAKENGELTGPPGEQGPKGDTPVKGVDYFTETDKQEIVGMVLDDIESSAQNHTFTDTITGQKYRLSVENGKLTMTEVTE